MLNKNIKYLIEACFVYTFYFFFWMLSIDAASNIGGRIARFIGPMLKVSRVAYNNLTLIFPEKTDLEKKEIIQDMWENLGRMVGESPHWSQISSKQFRQRVKVNREFKDLPAQGGLFISAHFGNFELASVISREEHLGVHLVYRPANNPYVDKLINKGRLENNVSLFPKGIAGVRMIQRTLQEGKMVGLLMDQKTNDGIDVPFLGHNAKTTSLPAKLALKYGSAIMFGRIQRTHGAHYEITLSKPMTIPKDCTPEKLTELINVELGKWVMEHPEQWFWVHKRWG